MKSHLKQALLYDPFSGGVTTKPPLRGLNTASQPVKTSDVYWKLLGIRQSGRESYLSSIIIQFSDHSTVWENISKT